MPVSGGTQATQAWLRSTWHIQVPQTWLDACVEWVTEEAGGVALPSTELNQQVLDQWLLTDLRALGYPVLPHGVSRAEKMELTGCYCLQMDSLLDVSQPAYSQLQRLRGSDCSNDEVSAVTQATQRPWEAKPTRMLMLHLTDGVQILDAIEYRPVPPLSANLPPGTKLQIVGTVMVRLGVLLLKPDNVKVLGGEVEELMETHSQSRVICRTLGLPEENHQREADDRGVQQTPRIEGTLDSGYESIPSSINSQLISRNATPQLENSRFSTIAATPTSRQSGPDLDEIPDDEFANIPDEILDYPEDIGNIPDDFDCEPDNWDHNPDDFGYEPDDWDHNPNDFGHEPDDWDHNDFSNTPEDFDDIPMEELDDIMSPTGSKSFPSGGPFKNGGTRQQDVLGTDNIRTDRQDNQASVSNQFSLPSNAPHSLPSKSPHSLPSKAPLSLPSKGSLSVPSKAPHSLPSKGSLSLLSEAKVIEVDEDDDFTSPGPNIARYESRSQVAENKCIKKADATILKQPQASNQAGLSFSTPFNKANRVDVIEVDADDDFTSPEPKTARYEPGSQDCSKTAEASTLNYLCILKAGVWPPRRAQLVRLHAFIVTLLGSLRSSGGEWKVKATISDGTGYLDVDLSDSLLQNLIGFSAAESKVLRKDPAKRGVVDAGIQNCQRELVDMCCVMSVKVDPNGTGTVLRADPLTDTECCEIQKRVTLRRS